LNQIRCPVDTYRAAFVGIVTLGERINGNGYRQDEGRSGVNMDNSPVLRQSITAQKWFFCPFSPDHGNKDHHAGWYDDKDCKAAHYCPG
jgi:hypothetical protein